MSYTPDHAMGNFPILARTSAQKFSPEPGSATLVNMVKGIRRTVATTAAIALAFSFCIAEPASGDDSRAVTAASPKNERIQGNDRFTTSANVSRVANPDPSSIKTVIIANGMQFPDGLSAASIAPQLSGTVLLSQGKTLSKEVLAELKRLNPESVILAGGTGAITNALQNFIKAQGFEVERWAGADRYETSAKIVSAGFPEGVDELFIATGTNYADALSASWSAATRSSALLIVPGNKSALPANLRNTINKLSPKNIVILGGTGAVTTGIEKDLSKVASVKRISGADRYEVAAKVATTFGEKSNKMVLVSGTNFPDAISATALAVSQKAPVLMTHPVCISPAVKNFTVKQKVQKFWTIGGPGAVRGNAASFRNCQSTTNPSSRWVLINKHNPLRPTGYAAPDLRRVNLSGGYSIRAEAATALENLNRGSIAAGRGRIGIASGNRSYSSQTSIYNNYLRTMGRSWTDRQSARPGFSEHQSGWAADIVACGNYGCGSIYSFGGTPQQKWVAENAHRYGFIVRYESGQSHITGYDPEPWHLRYVGTELAADYRSGGFKSLEAYFGVSAAPNYR